MERFTAIVKLGIKYLYRYRRRYIFLFTALSVCFAIVTFITSTKDGMYDNVYYAAQSHYAGDIIVRCYDTAGGDRFRIEQNEIAAVFNSVQIAGIKPRYSIQRTIHFEGAAVFFNGNAVPLRYVIGCNWEAEGFLLGKMIKTDSIYADLFTGEDGIILSSPTAQALGAKIGDSVVLEIETFYGSINTGVFIVKEIVQDVSIFGYYKAYVSRLSLNRLKLYDDDNCSVIGFFFDNPGVSEKSRKLLQKELSEKIPTGELVNTREENDRAIEKVKERRVLFLYSLPVYLSELSYLLDSMNIIAYVIYAMMLLIITVSTAVTYRLILQERAKEMGIMRTIGFLGNDLRLVLFTEIIVLGIISLAIGFILSYLFSLAASFFSFSWLPSFDIFMKNGKLVPLYLPITAFVNITIILFTLFFLVLFPSWRISGKKIPSLLSGESI
jgi:ABC-type lipoprotein release transport system permease subunit